MVFNIQTLMVATDFSEASEAAMTYAVRLARTVQARLFLVHVVPEYDVQVLIALGERLQSPLSAEAVREMLYTHADKRFATIVAQAQVVDLVQERLIVTGEPVETIVSLAASKQPQVLVLGTHRRRGVDHLLLGSVAERVLRQASCAVLIVPAQLDN